MTTFILTCLVLLLIGQFVLYRKIYRVHLSVFQCIDNVRIACDNSISQLEDLLALYLLIRPRRDLPKLRGWAASPDFLRKCIELLDEMLNNRRQLTVVEFGSGASTVVLANFLSNKNAGVVLSFDHDADYAEKTKNMLAERGLSNCAKVVHAPLTEVELANYRGKFYNLSIIARECNNSKVDVLIVDGPPAPIQADIRFPALPSMVNLLSCGAVIILDDADRSGEREIIAKWEDMYAEIKFEFVKTEKGLAMARWQGRAESI